MRRLICLLLLPIWVLPVHAVEAPAVPDAVLDAAPPSAEEVIEESDGLTEGLAHIGAWAADGLQSILQEQVRGAAAILLVVILCGLVESMSGETGSPVAGKLPTMVGALSITALTVGSLDSLMGLGAHTIQELDTFSKALLPALAAAAAASGAVTSASLQQVSTVFFAGLLLQLIDRLLMPLAYLYTGTLTAAAILPGSRLKGLAELLKKIVSSILGIALLAFTLYLSVAHIVSGSADALTVKVAKATVSSVVPVVGGILSDTTETVLAGAGMLRNTIGVFGMLAVLAACVFPFLRLGIQYLLYKLTALLAGVTGSAELGKLIDGLGGAFGLVLGMTGVCATTLLVSILASVSAVTG